MRLAESFVSINGEGPRAGELALFLRFVGCNLSCSYCDTRWANEPGCEYEDKSIEELIDLVASSGIKNVTLTGGEPMLQQELPTLARGLLRLHGIRIEIETNGAVSLCEMAGIRAKAEPYEDMHGQPGEAGLSDDGSSRMDGTGLSYEVHGQPGEAGSSDDGKTVTRKHENKSGNKPENKSGNKPVNAVRLSFTMDYKLPSSGCESAMLTDNFRYLRQEDTVKFVSGCREDLERAADIISQHNLTERCHVYISPVYGSIDPQDIVGFMAERKMNDVRLQLQLHKLIWDPCKRGV